MQDNNYKTWDNYANEYWPAEYLIDKQGHVRHTHFGEGRVPADRVADPKTARRQRGSCEADRGRDADGADDARELPGLRAPRRTTPARDRFRTSTTSTTSPPTIPANTLSYDGHWRVGGQQIVAGKDARLRLRFQARDVYLVLGGHGTVARADRRQAGRHDPRRRVAALHGSQRRRRRDGAARAALHARRPGVLVHVRLARD